MKEMIKVGCIVECINDTFPADLKAEIQTPIKGKLYTVIGVVEKPKGIGIYLAEIKDKALVIYPTFKRIENIPFLASRFSIAISNEIKLEELMKDNIKEIV